MKSILWGLRYRALIDLIKSYHSRMEYGLEEDFPTLHYKDLYFSGFPNTTHEAGKYRAIARALPDDFPGSHYRIMRDFVTRYLYPHMMPTLRPAYPISLLGGFHRQHSDAVADIRGSQTREELHTLFTIKSDDVIINCGAYIGFGDMSVSRWNPDGMIVAVEAAEPCFRILEKNVTKNNIRNVKTMHHGVWSHSGMMDLSITELQGNSLVDGFVEAKQVKSVESINIDEIVIAHRLQKVDYISLTLNGAEIEAIDGMEETVKVHKPRIRLAGWYERDGVPIWRTVKEKLEKLGYRVVVGKRGNVFAV